jgi:hypothetical protein
MHGVKVKIKFVCQRFGTLFRLHRRCKQEEQIVPKRRLIKFRRREITQKKEYSVLTAYTTYEDGTDSVPKRRLIQGDQKGSVHLISVQKKTRKNILNIFNH